MSRWLPAPAAAGSSLAVPAGAGAGAAPAVAAANANAATMQAPALRMRQTLSVVVGKRAGHRGMGLMAHARSFAGGLDLSLRAGDAPPP